MYINKVQIDAVHPETLHLFRSRLKCHYDGNIVKIFCKI